MKYKPGQNKICAENLRKLQMPDYVLQKLDVMGKENDKY